MGLIKNGIIINNNKSLAVQGQANVQGISIQGKLPYKASSDISSSTFFDFVNLTNVSVVDGVWDMQYQLIYNTESISQMIPSIFFDFAELQNINVVDGVWDSEEQLIYNTEIALPIVPNLFFDFENLTNINVIDGVWDMQYQLIYNTEVI